MKTNPAIRNRHIALACLLSFVIVLGCRPKHALTKDEVFEANFALFQPPIASRQEVQPDILDQIPLRLRSLKSGMTPREVFKALNLPNNLNCASGSGAQRFYRLGFNLRTNRFMVMKFNMLQQPPSFIEAELYGEGWGDLQRWIGRLIIHCSQSRTPLAAGLRLVEEVAQLAKELLADGWR
jgi:hypothetical protein